MTGRMQANNVATVFRKIGRLGGRTLTAMAAALIAAVLIFAAPEIGIGSAIGGVILGGISAVLIRPHAGV